MQKHKTTSEVFGCQINEKTKPNIVDKIKRYDYKYPFTNKKCNKQSRLISYPMGVCSVYQNNEPIIVCPQRFIQQKTIFEDVAKEFLGGIDNVLYFSEVGLKGIGSFDYVLVKHKPLSSEIDDFVIIEVQSDSTTGTGKLVKNLEEIMDKQKTASKSYAFGMNTYNTIKLAFIQMLNKGLVAERWDKNIVWVMQDFVFQNMLDRFELNRNHFSKKKRSHFFIYALREQKQKSFDLILNSKASFTNSELMKAFSSDRNIPDIDDFIERLEQKVKIELKINN